MAGAVINDDVGTPHLLCLSQSSNEGKHWNIDHCPYDDGPVEVYAPQHTHLRIFRRMGAMRSLRRIGVGGRRCTSVGWAKCEG